MDEWRNCRLVIRRCWRSGNSLWRVGGDVLSPILAHHAAIDCHFFGGPLDQGEDIARLDVALVLHEAPRNEALRIDLGRRSRW